MNQTPIAYRSSSVASGELLLALETSLPPATQNIVALAQLDPVATTGPDLLRQVLCRLFESASEAVSASGPATALAGQAAKLVLPGSEAQRQKNQPAISLLRQWLAEDSGYDEAVWPELKRSVEENRLSPRKRFHD